MAHLGLMLPNEEIALAILTDEILLCPRCEGLGKQFVYSDTPQTRGCILCMQSSYPGYVMVKPYGKKHWQHYLDVESQGNVERTR